MERREFISIRVTQVNEKSQVFCWDLAVKCFAKGFQIIGEGTSIFTKGIPYLPKILQFTLLDISPPPSLPPHFN